MKKIRSFLLSVVAGAAIAACGLFAVHTVNAQDAAAPAADAVAVTAAQPELPAAAVGIIDTLVLKFPWLTTVLSIYATAAIGWQLIIAFAHNWAAKTSDVKDDQWIAKLEAFWWFRAADKFFYFGGYFGAWKGGKKL